MLAMFEWNAFTEWKLWGLIALGVLAFLAGAFGLLNGSEGPDQRDKGQD